MKKKISSIAHSIKNYFFIVFIISIANIAFAQSSVSDFCKDSYDGIGYTEDYKGEPILAEAKGIVKVISNKMSFGPYKNCDQYVVLMHTGSNGKIVYTRYGEIRTNLKIGTEVKKGTVIGYAGKTREWYFETRPVLKKINGEVPYWDLVRTTDPEKFDWKTFNPNYVNTPRAPQSWDRYKETDLDDLIEDSLKNAKADGNGVNVFLNLPAYRMKVKFDRTPFKCNSDEILEEFKNGPVKVGDTKLPESNYCVTVRSARTSNYSITMPVQDSVAFDMFRQFQKGDELDIYAIYLFMRSTNNRIVKVGFIINTYNIPLF